MKQILPALLLVAITAAHAAESKLWYDKPANGWANEALPIGNGDLGAMVFGKTDLERIQFNEKSLWTGNEGDAGSNQAFGDLLIQLGHQKPTEYRRELDLERGVQTLTYLCNGVRYRREIIASNPAGIIAMRFTADKPGAYSGKLWLTDMHGADVLADASSPEGNRLTATGILNNGMDYESQVLVNSEGGTVTPVFEPGFDNKPVKRLRPEVPVLDGAKDVYLSLRVSDKPEFGYYINLSNDDAMPGRSPLVIKGDWFDRGVTFQAPNEFSFNLGGKYQWLTFHTLVAEEGILRIDLDGKTAREIPAGKEAQYVTIPVAGVKTLKLRGALADPKSKKQPEVLLGHLRLSPSKTEPAKDPGVARNLKGNPPVVLALDKCDSFTILLGARTSYLADRAKGWQGPHPHAALTELMNKGTRQPFNELLAQHEKDYRSLFGRVSLELGTTDAAIAALPTDQRKDRYAKGEIDPGFDALCFQFGRYLMIASSRKGGLPANLQGVWNDSNRAAWRCDYHTDLNVQMNYWMAGPANLSECATPLLNWILSVREVLGEQTAKEFHARGWTTRGENGIFGGGGWKWVPASGAWLCQNLFEHYEFTQDKEYLKRLYPLLKEACEFWGDRLKALPDGTLVVPHDFSPEHGPEEDGVSFGQELVWDVFNNYIRASQDLGVDESYRAKVAGMQQKLLVPKIGKWGQLQEWIVDRDLTDEPHRHTSHLVGLYPGRQIARQTTPELAKAAGISLAARSLTDDGCQSWTWPWRSALWARLGNSDKAYEMLRGCTIKNRYPNLFTHMGVFQIDGNLGTTAAMAEMLLQSPSTGSGEPQIELLPALPKAWANGSVKGLRARGGLTVDIEWKEGKVTRYRVASPDQRAVKVQVNGKTKTIKSEKIAAAKPEEEENNPYALGIIQRPGRTAPPALEMAPVNLADLTADYGKDFSDLTKCPTYLKARKRAPYNPEKPAEPVVFTEAQKQEQLVAGAAMLKEIVAAIAGGKKEYLVASGTYRIKEPIRLSHAHDFTLKFNKAEIYLGDCGTFIESSDAQRVNVLGPVEVTLDPKPFTMTRVASVNREAAEVTLTLMNGWDAKNVPESGSSLIFDPNGRLLPARLPGFKNLRIQGEKGEKLVMNINPDHWYYCDPDKGDRTGLCWQFFKPGNIVWIMLDKRPGGPAIRQRDKCSEITYQDINLHCFRNWLYGGADGDITFRRVRAIGRPGTNQISGGMCQFFPSRGQIRFEECEIQGDADDQIDILSMSHMVYAQKGPREIWVKSRTGNNDPFHPGVTMKFHDFDYSENHGTAVITAAEPVKEKKLVEQCNAWVGAAGLSSMREGWVYRVTLDRDVEVKPMDLVELSDSRTDKLVLSGCYFHDGCTRVLIHGTKETIVEKCAFEREQMSSLQIGAEKYWWEGPHDQRITVRDSLFVNGSNGMVNGHATIRIGVADVGMEATCRDLTEQVCIENNVIIAPAKQAICVRNAARAVVRNNRIIRPCIWPKFLSRSSQFGEDFSAIYLYAVGSAEVSGNTIKKPGPNMSTPVILSETTAAPVSIQQ